MKDEQHTGPALYLYDAANGVFTSVGRAVIPLVSYVGPFKDKNEVIEYLCTMTGYTKGADIPKGYAIIEIHQPMTSWRTVEELDPFSWKKRGTPFRFDRKLRYDMVPKPVKKKRKK